MAIVFVWMEVETQRYDPPASKLTWELVIKKILGRSTDDAVVEEQEPELAKVLDVYEVRLAQSKYLGGDSISLADLHHLPTLCYLMGSRVKTVFNSRPHVSAWCADILARPAFKKVVAMRNNQLLTPYISSGIILEVFKLWIKGCKIIVLDVPLLFEAKMDKWTKPIIVVWVNTETQLQRLMARDGTTAEEANSRINAQMSLDLKRDKADIVIDNSGSLEDLNEQFREVLVHVKNPLTWTEFGLSRDGAITAFFPLLFGVIICWRAL
ncbi:hypothetical protein RD792_017018 [Penstemon davidsonii]|uniref:glutathione transferase n=1 Tax=Penstemon davidsonii TaxID=160366 RepID=A0ABR0CMQ7_9LAMI|nr:hypothetical protein RD792_017018 [Penstemon davidsonii]